MSLAYWILFNVFNLSFQFKELLQFLNSTYTLLHQIQQHFLSISLRQKNTEEKMFMYCAFGYHYQHIVILSIWDSRFLGGKLCTYLTNSVTACGEPRSSITQTFCRKWWWQLEIISKNLSNALDGKIRAKAFMHITSLFSKEITNPPAV